MSDYFIFGILFGALIVPALHLFCVATEAIKTPEIASIRIRCFAAELIFSFTPGDWVWMAGRYKRRQFYEYWRSRSIQLENDLRKAQWRADDRIRKRYGAG